MGDSIGQLDQVVDGVADFVEGGVLLWSEQLFQTAKDVALQDVESEGRRHLGGQGELLAVEDDGVPFGLGLALGRSCCSGSVEVKHAHQAAAQAGSLLRMVKPVAPSVPITPTVMGRSAGPVRVRLVSTPSVTMTRGMTSR